VRKYAKRPAVVNMSLGSPYSAAVNTATKNLANSGIFVAVAAGNDNRDACSYSPSSAVGTVTVGATDSNDVRYASSNHGACVDLYAPGYGIQSTYGSGSALLTGTSMASPHVAGVAALYKGDYGDWDYKTIANWITASATTNRVVGNVGSTPNRLLYKYNL
jgi:subtilisin family serine protease